MPNFNRSSIFKQLSGSKSCLGPLHTCQPREKFSRDKRRPVERSEAGFGRGVRGSFPGNFQKPVLQMGQCELFLSYICQYNYSLYCNTISTCVAKRIPTNLRKSVKLDHPTLRRRVKALRRLCSVAHSLGAGEHPCDHQTISKSPSRTYYTAPCHCPANLLSKQNLSFNRR